MTRSKRPNRALFALMAGTALATACVPNREGGPDLLTAGACRPVPLAVGTADGVRVTGLYDLAVSADAGVLLLAGTTAVPTDAAAVSADSAGSDAADGARPGPPAGVFGIVLSDLALYLDRSDHPAAGATLRPAPPAGPPFMPETAAETGDAGTGDRAGSGDTTEAADTMANTMDVASGGAATAPRTDETDPPAADDGGRPKRLGASAVPVPTVGALQIGQTVPEDIALDRPLPVADLSGPFAAKHPFYPVGLSVVQQPDLTADPARGRSVGLMVANAAATPAGAGSVEMFVFAPGGLIYERSLALPESCPPLDVAALDPERAFVTVERHAGCPGGLTAGGAPGPVGDSALIYLNRDEAQVVASGLDDARGLSLEPLNFWATTRHLAVAGARTGALLIYDLDDLLTGTTLSEPSRQHAYTVDLPYTVRALSWTPDGQLYGAAALETVELAALGTGVEIPTAVPTDRARVWRLHAPRTDITVPSVIQIDEDGLYPDLDAVAVAGDLLLLGSATRPELQVCTLSGTPPYKENLSGIQPDR